MTSRRTYTARVVDGARRGIENCLSLAIAILLFSLAHGGGISFGKLLSLFTH
jgi:hypothetical protein